MTRIIQALYEDGVLKPLQPLEGVAERSQVQITVEVREDRPHPLSECFGILPDEDAEEMRRIIEEEFERVDENEWR